MTGQTVASVNVRVHNVVKVEEANKEAGEEA